jgi:c(7)-type cytochrome triheme protein
LAGGVAALVSAPLLAVNSPEEVLLAPLTARTTPPPARFSHWSHRSAQCFACHPSVFPQAVTGFTHESMQAGQHCGACHEGRTARAIGDMKCEACHAAR